MMLFPDVICEFGVGGERMEMSMAVPRRRGTSGVSSRATKGRPLLVISSGPVMTEATSEKASRSSTGPGADRGTPTE